MKGVSLVFVLIALISATKSAEKKIRLQNQEQCLAPPDTGLCGTSGTVRRWFFNADSAQCETFRWGFCGDQNNVFRSRSICERYCIAAASNGDSTTASGNALLTNRPFKREFTPPALDDTTPTDTASTSTTTTSTTTPPPVTTCAPNDCSLLSCSGSVVTSFDPDTGCPTCHCVISDVTATDVPRDDTTIPEVNREDLVVSEELPFVEDPCEFCDGVCRQGDSTRDVSVECDVTSCQCLSSDEKNVSQTTSMCSELPVECICSENEAPTSAIDENGCDICKCVESELRDENQPIMISTSQFVCPEIECDLTCDNENEAGFESDENGCHRCACQVHQQIEEDQPDMVVTTGTDADADVADEKAVPCMDLTQCTVSCPFGYQIDALTGCETCECHHVVPSDERSDDYDHQENEIQPAVVFAPSPPPLCQPEVVCDTSSCIRAFDPTSKCDLCLCDDDFGGPEIQVKTNSQSVDAATGREDIDIENKPSGATNSGAPEAEDEDDVCVNQLSCSSDCFPVRNDLGCVADCQCLDNSDVVTSPPLTEMNPCPVYKCSCSGEDGLETIRFIDDDGCPACKCLPIVTVAVPPAEEVEEEVIVPVTASRQGVDDQDEVDEDIIVPGTSSRQGDDDQEGVEEEIIVPVTSSRQGVDEQDEVDEDIIVPVTASRQGDDDQEEVEEEVIVPVTAPTLGRDRPVEPTKENIISLPVADARKVWCSLLPERGSCRANLERWYHDHTSGTCIVFTYSGCRGNANNFRSKLECQRYCKAEINAERNEKQKWYKRILGFKHQ